jgi:hypothetical protein
MMYNKHMHDGGIYFFAFLGVAFYYIKNANSFSDGVIGLLKAIVWPAILTYKLFMHMHW